MSSKKRKLGDEDASKKSSGRSAAQEDEAFPRGGGSVLTPLEQRKLTLQAKADVEREAAFTTGKSSKRAKKGASFEDEEASFFQSQSSAGRLPKFVELLRFTNMAVGAKVWGTVMEVSAKRLIVSLPHGLRGFVAPEEASDVLRALLKPESKKDKALAKTARGPPPTLQELFYVGQFVRCAVLALQEGQAAGEDDGKKGKGKQGKATSSKKIHLTLRLAEVCKGLDKNSFPVGAVVPAVVRTVEDHGFALDFGLRSVTGFLSLADFQAAFGPSAVARPGLLLQTVVKDNGRGGGNVVVDCDASRVASQVTEEFHGVTMSSLLPGQLVTVTVRNVLSDGLLVSFLKFFHGTVDQFHMPIADVGRDWHAAFAANQRLKARVLYVDSEAKVVRLSLLKNLVGYHLPEAMPLLGDVFEQATVLRADRALGLLLKLPTQPVPCMGYVHISNVSDDETDSNLMKSFPAGSAVAARVIGFRPLDSLATLSMKSSTMSQSFVTWSTLEAGAVIDASVQKVEDFGLVLKVTSSIAGVVPVLHISEAATPKNFKGRFKIGQTLRCRVMDVDAANRKLTLTLKKGIIDSKLPPLLSKGDARPGTRAHGFVTGVTEKGVFVEFFNRVQGLVAPSEISLPLGQALTDAYSVGQVIKCTVIGVDPRKGLKLSLRSKQALSLEGEKPVQDRLGHVQPCAVLRDARVERVLTQDGGSDDPAAFMLQVTSGTQPVAARLEAAHLSDHPHAAQTLAGLLQVGAVLPEVVVLERREQAGLLLVSAKASLVEAAKKGALPSSLAALVHGAVVPGFIASVTKDACFVRFAGGLTGRAGLPQVADTFVSDPSAYFSVGQSVKAQIIADNVASGRFSVSLKPSLTCGQDATFLSTFFRDMQLACKLQPEETSSEGPALGALVDVTADEERDYGYVCDISGDDDLLWDGIVDLSLKQALVDSSKKPKHQRKLVSALSVGDSVDGTVELVKEDPMYLVASLPSLGGALGYAATSDFNIQGAAAARSFQPGQRISAVVAQLPGEAGGRLLLHVPLATAAPKAPKSLKAKAKPGSVVSARVTAVHPLHADMQIGQRKGRLHITEMRDLTPEAAAAEVGKSLLEGLKAGGEVTVAVLGQAAAAGAKQHRILELSARASAIQAAQAGSPVAAHTAWDSLTVGSQVLGAVQEVAADHLYVALSPSVRGRVHILHASSDLAKLAAFRRSFAVGGLVVATVLSIDQQLQRLDLSLLRAGEATPLQKGAPNPEAGVLVMGKVTAMSGRGVRLALSNGAIASVALTDLHDRFVPNALEGLRECPYVCGRVMQPGQLESPGSLRLSLKQSDGGSHSGHSQPVDGPETPACGAEVPLKKGDKVHGYVKSVQGPGSKGAGVFVSCSSSQEARVKLSLLADHYVDDPVTAFPEGKHVSARVLQASGGRVDLTLKSTQTGSERWQTLTALEVGQVVSGRVKRVEKYGVFVEIADSLLTGLAHISELSDAFMKDPASKFQPGMSVRAIVLQKDEAAGKISLGLKPSYFADAETVAAGRGGADNGALGDASEPKAKRRGADDDDDSSEDMDVDAAIAAAFDASSDEDDDEDSGMEVDEVVGGAEEAGDSDEEDPSSAEEEEEDEEDEEAGHTPASAPAEGDDSDDEDSDEADEEDALESSKERARSGAGASTSAKGDAFGWDAFALVGDDEDEAEAKEADVPTKTSKRAAKRAREQHEASVRQAELARLEDSAPTSEEDFERLALASPNSSFVWIRYMAFLLSMSEVEKARALAERALKTIDYREQHEKFNVWLAYLNLENTFAENPEEAASALLQRALQYNDAKKMYLAAIGTFEKSNREELAANCRKAMCRKFGGSCKVWLKVFEHAISTGKDPKAVLDRATNALPTRKHVKFLSRGALMEMKQGSQERGRAMFEGLLRAYPKRSDIWSVYIDQEIRVGDQTSIRNLFERAIHLQLPPKKMKFFFKWYVAYEVAHGSEQSVAYVKKQAMEYIQGLKGQA